MELVLSDRCMVVTSVSYSQWNGCFAAVCASSPCQNNATCNINEVAQCTCVGGFTGYYCESGKRAQLHTSRLLHTFRCLLSNIAYVCMYVCVYVCMYICFKVIFNYHPQFLVVNEELSF